MAVKPLYLISAGILALASSATSQDIPGAKCATLASLNSAQLPNPTTIITSAASKPASAAVPGAAGSGPRHPSHHRHAAQRRATLGFRPAGPPRLRLQLLRSGHTGRQSSNPRLLRKTARAILLCRLLRRRPRSDDDVPAFPGLLRR